MNYLYELIKITLPSLIMGVMVFIALKLYFNRTLKLFLNNEANRKTFELHKQQSKQLTLNKIQACERFAIYLERINPTQLVLRIKPTTTQVPIYIHTLNQIIEQEFEHNIAQQIYLQDHTYSAIKKAKKATQSMIIHAGEHVESAEELQKVLMSQADDHDIPSNIALRILKDEMV
ncbi:MAG: hypothetical protein ACK5MD_03170 [Flavobacteriales bacterium]